MITAKVNDIGLVLAIKDFARATGRTVEDVSRAAMKSMVKYALDYTPPAGKSKGKSAQRAGERAIVRDLGLMGFVPVEIKGFRTITSVFGRKVAPVKVKTKLNPKFEDIEGHHRARMASKHGGHVTRGGPQAWYVDRKKLNIFRIRLFARVGRLSSGWASAARQLGVSVPVWIRRHGDIGRGTTVIKHTKGKLFTLNVTNHVPATAADIAEDMRRRVTAFREYVANGFRRQLKAQLAGKWKSRR